MTEPSTVRAPGQIGVVFPAANRRGGVERVAWDLLEHLAETRGGATFLGRELSPRGNAKISFVEVRPRSVPTALAPLAFRSAAHTAASARDLKTLISFGANCPPGDVLWVQSVHKAWLSRSRHVTWHGRDVPARVRYALLRHQVLLRMERQYFTSQRPRLILCTSQQEVEDLVQFYDVARPLMRVVPNGFDPGQFSPNRREDLRTTVRPEMADRRDDIVLLFVANELHRKGFGETLQAVHLLGDPRVRISLVGRRPPTDYAAVIARLGLQDRVRYHGATDDVGRWHAGADLLVLPTQYEPFGIVIVEALASGLPVITSRLAGAAQAITHGKSGLLQEDPYDIEELTGLLKQALDADLAEWGRAAVSASAPYQWPKIFNGVDALLPR